MLQVFNLTVFVDGSHVACVIVLLYVLVSSECFNHVGPYISSGLYRCCEAGKPINEAACISEPRLAPGHSSFHLHVSGDTNMCYVVSVIQLVAILFFVFFVFLYEILCGPLLSFKRIQLPLLEYICCAVVDNL